MQRIHAVNYDFAFDDYNDSLFSFLLNKVVYSSLS